MTYYNDENGVNQKLIDAAEEGDTYEALEAIGEGADIDCRDENQSTPLIIASRSGHLDIVKLLLRHQARVNAENRDGETALMLASREGYSKIVRRLLKKNAAVNARNKYDGGTALMEAAIRGSIHALEYLIAKGANLHAKDNRGFTALDWARRFKNISVVDFLSQVTVTA
jgi:ankyrin repeat protein